MELLEWLPNKVAVDGLLSKLGETGEIDEVRFGGGGGGV